MLTGQQKDVEKEIEKEKKDGNTYVVLPADHAVSSPGVSKGV